MQPINRFSKTVDNYVKYRDFMKMLDVLESIFQQYQKNGIITFT